MKIGLISDTHGYVNPKIFDLFEEAEMILHAGDVGREDVIADLEAIAPVHAVNGNMDAAILQFPETKFVDAGGLRIMITHNIGNRKSVTENVLRRAKDGGAAVVVYGHSHFAANDVVDGIRFVNPGAACKPRFRDAPSVGELIVEDGEFDVRIHSLI